VRGIDGLRVIDASAMPFIPSGNTNAPTMALADRAVTLMDHGASPCLSPGPASSALQG
jgi:choline dehydrogenase-like flavoprotein